LIAPNASKYAEYSASLILFREGGVIPSRGWLFLLIMRLLSARSFNLQEFEQFRARHEQLSPQHPACAQFPALDHPINTEVVDAQKLCGLIN
jgi:hypothetical protein